jgi:hypothetical protein
VTTIHEALEQFPVDRLQRYAGAFLQWRDQYATTDRPQSALWNALLCAALDVQKSRREVEADLFDHLIPNPVRIVGMELPGRDE